MSREQAPIPNSRDASALHVILYSVVLPAEDVCTIHFCFEMDSCIVEVNSLRGRACNAGDANIALLFGPFPYNLRLARYPFSLWHTVLQ